MEKYKRTLEDVEKVIGHAKLSTSEVRPVTQTLYMASSLTKYRLLELDTKVLTALKYGDKVAFKGEKNEKAVLCTQNSTYDVKEAETSNSVLIIPDLKFASDISNSDERCILDTQIEGIHFEYLELRKIKPKLSKLKNCLVPYNGPENESPSILKKTDIFNVIQASEDEIKTALVEIDAFQVNGVWRILDEDYLFRMLGHLLNLAESESWPYDKIPLRDTMDALRDLIPKEVLYHLIEAYLEPTGEFDDNGDEFFSFKVDKTCKFLGEYLLKPAKNFNLDDFLQAWQSSVPEGMETNLKQLSGIALVTENVHPSYISYLPESKFPESPKERFSELFAIKEKWTYEEIEPYVKRIACDKQPVSAILTKFTRVNNVNGTKYYMSRHGK